MINYKTKLHRQQLRLIKFKVMFGFMVRRDINIQGFILCFPQLERMQNGINDMTKVICS